MQKRRVVLRADACKRTGYGHFIRTLALANHIKDGYTCLFATYNEDEPYGTASFYQLEQLGDVCEPLELAGRNVHEADEMFLGDLRPDDIVVLDNYYFTPAYQQQVKDKGCKLVCIDDIPGKRFVCDVLITGSPLSRTDFRLPSGTVFKSGIEWFFLRDAFLQGPPARTRKPKICNVVMAMGGSDALNLTDRMIGIIGKVLPDVTLNVIAGDGVRISDEEQKDITVYRNLSASEMVKLYDGADLGIFPSSTVAVEALSRNLPVIAGHYVDNQRVLYDFGVNKGYFSPLGNLLDSDRIIEDRLKRALRLNLPSKQLTCFQTQRQRTLDLFRKL